VAKDYFTNNNINKVQEKSIGLLGRSLSPGICLLFIMFLSFKKSFSKTSATQCIH
jgi:hypothetical protein